MKLTRRRFLELLGLGAVAAAVGGAKVLEGAGDVGEATESADDDHFRELSKRHWDDVLGASDDIGGYIVPEPYAIEIRRRFLPPLVQWGESGVILDAND